MTPLAPVFAVAAFSTLLLTPMIRAVAPRLRQVDRGDDDGQQAITPRMGGVAIATAWTGTLLAMARYGPDAIRSPLTTLPLVSILTGSLLVFAIGLIDDVRPAPAGVKIAVEVVAAGLLIAAGVVIERLTVFGVTFHLGWLSSIVTIVWIVGIANAFNLMDGLDGLATGLAIIAGVTCAAIVILRGELPTAVLLITLLGALVGFLPFNFNPASIFLGDGGSLLIGFVLALTAITGLQKGATALAVGVPVLIFALPLVDTVTTVVRRLRGSTPAVDRPLRGVVTRLLRPDREHIHHRLVSRGLSHRSAVLVLYAIAVCFAALAFLTMEP